MTGYISEFSYYGDSSTEFVEVALPMGTDPTGYVVQFYMNNGVMYGSFSLGSAVATMAGHDIYVIDQSTPGFASGDAMGNFYPDDAIALIDGDGTVVQFVSWNGNTITASGGLADGATSTPVGSSGIGESLQSDDGGSSYYAQASTNPGTIPACYGPGTRIATRRGNMAVEAMRPGDQVFTGAGATATVRWLWSGEERFDTAPVEARPVLIGKDALGPNRPAGDLVVSGQHRILVGGFGQLDRLFAMERFLPAKALTVLPGVRFMRGKSRMMWHHFLCEEHEVVFANRLASESLLLGGVITRSLSASQLAQVSRSLGRRVTRSTRDQPVHPSMHAGEARRLLRRQRGPNADNGPALREVDHRLHRHIA